MIRVDEALAQSDTGARLLLQVHDELLLECAADKAEEVRDLVVREMQAAGERLTVPLEVTVAWGSNWNQAHG